MKNAPKPIVEVRWVDANSTHGWAPPKEVAESGVSPCCTVGYLLADTPEAIVIASSLDLSDHDTADHIQGVSGSIVIPKKMVVGTRRLTIPRVAVKKLRKLR